MTAPAEVEPVDPLPLARVAPQAVTVLGTGSALPGPAVTSEALIERMERTFGIRKGRLARELSRRIGVESRHVVRDFASRREAPRPGHRNPELAAAALGQALERARLRVDDLGYVLAHTATPARPLPTNASEVAACLRYRGPFAEFRQACTGFATALQFASALLAHPDAAPVAIVGSETGSVYFDPMRLQEDHAQWVNLLQMGDGAGAIILGPARPDTVTLRSSFVGQLGVRSSGLHQASGGSDQPWVDSHVLGFEHDYRAVAEHGPGLLDAGRAVLESRGERLDDVRRIVPHQANGRMAEWLRQRWQVVPAQCFGNGRDVGNLGSASIWVALDALLQSKQLDPGDRAWFLGAEATQYTFGGFVLHDARRSVG
jgi:3-oxoacyl-[acyl-carrier-protein] synthase III